MCTLHDFLSSKVRFIHTSTVTGSESCFGKSYAYASRTSCLHTTSRPTWQNYTKEKEQVWGKQTNIKSKLYVGLTCIYYVVDRSTVTGLMAILDLLTKWQ